MLLLWPLMMGGASSSHADAPRSVILWHSYRSAERETLDKLIRDFNARQSDIHVEALAVPNDSFSDKLEATIPRGEGPDIFVFAHDRLGDFVAKGLVQPIEFFVDDSTCDRFLRPTIDALAYGGSLYGLPLDFKSVALFYNRTLVKSPPRTTDELLRIARALTDAPEHRWGLAYADDKLYYFAGWLYGFGGGIFTPRGELDIDTPPAEQAVAFVRDLAGPDGVVPPEITGAKASELFRSGRAAMVIDGPWLLGDLAGGPPFGVAPLPIVSSTGKRAAPFSGTEGIFMAADARAPEAAYEVIAYLTSDAAALQRARDAHQLVANTACYTDPRIASDPVIRAFRAQLLDTVPMPSTPAMQSVWSAYDLALERAITGTVTPHDALATAERDIRHLLDVSTGPRR